MGVIIRVQSKSKQPKYFKINLTQANVFESFLFSVPGSPREIQFWVANANGASYFSMALHGQSLFR